LGGKRESHPKNEKRNKGRTRKEKKRKLKRTAGRPDYAGGKEGNADVKRPLRQGRAAMGALGGGDPGSPWRERRDPNDHGNLGKGVHGKRDHKAKGKVEALERYGPCA